MMLSLLLAHFSDMARCQLESVIRTKADVQRLSKLRAKPPLPDHTRRTAAPKTLRQSLRDSDTTSDLELVGGMMASARATQCIQR
jgi:hypothetical protein